MISSSHGSGLPAPDSVPGKNLEIRKRRAEVLEVLKARGDAGMTAGQIAEETKIRADTVRNDLQALKNVGLVREVRDSALICYVAVQEEASQPPTAEAGYGESRINGAGDVATSAFSVASAPTAAPPMRPLERSKRLSSKTRRRQRRLEAVRRHHHLPIIKMVMNNPELRDRSIDALSRLIGIPAGDIEQCLAEIAGRIARQEQERERGLSPHKLRRQERRQDSSSTNKPWWMNS